MKQYFKSIYFSDHPSTETNSKSLTIAFSEPEAKYYKRIKELSNEEIRELAGVKSFQQLSLFAQEEERSVNQTIKRLIKKNLKEYSDKFISNDVTFVNSKSVPFQRWYPYIEGYSPEFIKQLISHYVPDAKCIYDPFAGTGTTLFSADSFNISTVFSEVNPLLQFLIQTKIDILNCTPVERATLAYKLLKVEKTFFKAFTQQVPNENLAQTYQTVFGKSQYFTADTFQEVLKMRTYINKTSTEDKLLADILTIAVLSSLLPISLLKKAGDVRFKTAKELEKPQLKLEDVLTEKLRIIQEDLNNPRLSLKTTHDLILSNAKNIDRIHHTPIDAVITSPPYLNGTNYFRNTKLELWFLGFLKFGKELRKFRDRALTSGINDVVSKKGISRISENEVVQSSLFEDTLVELEKKTYDKRIPIMAKSYFAEMQGIFTHLRTHLQPNTSILIDIGDSIFANVHIQTDNILIEILQHLGYKFIEKKLLRKRRSRNQTILSQTLLVFEYPPRYHKMKSKKTVKNKQPWQQDWKVFKTELPYQQPPFNKRNWGNLRHSLCSYQGKLKPSIAHHLVQTFVPEGGTVLDPFSGVGTIPFEAALNQKHSFGLDISVPAFIISSAKTGLSTPQECNRYLKKMDDYILNNQCSQQELEEVAQFGFNKKLADYYEAETMKEIILARRFTKEYFPVHASEMLVISALLHILHGNRPYALSRRSHSIVPYAPTGEFVYKNLVEKVREKVNRTFKSPVPENFTPGKIFLQDTTKIWPMEIDNLDAVITSPPFFDSTRFYLANWIRIWFAGWSTDDFKGNINLFVEEKQKKDFKVYESIFRQSRERLKSGGVCVLHLGKSKKCDMAAELQKVSKRWFKKADLFDESVAHCESHGIRDKGTVTSHQYLILE